MSDIFVEAQGGGGGGGMQRYPNKNIEKQTRIPWMTTEIKRLSAVMKKIQRLLKTKQK